ADPAHPGREVGWVTEPAPEYGRAVARLAVRCRKENGQWGLGVLITNLDATRAAELSSAAPTTDVRLRYAYLYDGRGGGAETTFKEDQQGLGRRYKKRWAAAQM